jgi:hypothetical protein
LSRDEFDVWSAANALPTASWNIAVDTSPVRTARRADVAKCFAVILPPESEHSVVSQLS